MKTKTLRDLYISELKDLYSAETQLLKALPKMAKAASTPELREAFTSHLKETEGHVTRLDTIFSKLEVSPRGKKCQAMEGLVKEGKAALEEWDEDTTVRDAALISAAQRVEHYEMAGYGCVRTFAKLLGEHEAVQLLQQTLDEEGQADKKLTGLAEQINVEAVTPEEEEAPVAAAAKSKSKKAVKV